MILSYLIPLHHKVRGLALASQWPWSASCTWWPAWPQAWVSGRPRVLEIAPNTVRAWLVEAAEQRQACTASLLCDVHGKHGQLAAW